MAISPLTIGLISGTVGAIIGRLSVRLISRDYLTRLYDKIHPFELIVLPETKSQFSRAPIDGTSIKRFRTIEQRLKYVESMGYVHLDDCGAKTLRATRS